MKKSRHAWLFITSSQWHVDGFEDLLEGGFGFVRPAHSGRIARIYYYAMRENGDNQSLDVIGNDIVASFDKGQRLSSVIQGETASRTYAEIQKLR